MRPAARASTCTSQEMSPAHSRQLGRTHKESSCPPSESEQKEIRAWKKEDNKAIALLTNRLPDHLLQKHCRDGMTSAEMWSAIITAHEKTGLHSEMLALNPILQRYQDGDDMEAFIAQKRNAQQKLSALGVPFHDRLLALLLLHSMPDSFAAAKSTLTHLHRDTFTFESVADALVSEYTLRQAATAASSEHGESAMYAANNRGKKTNSRQPRVLTTTSAPKSTAPGAATAKTTAGRASAILSPTVCTRHLEALTSNNNSSSDLTTQATPSRPTWLTTTSTRTTSLSASYQRRDAIAPTRWLCIYPLRPPDDTSIWCVD